ncbi:trypsin-like peptidase domain-containing protein [Yoonia sediminilitoris]|uniref:Putative peptidoglycan binding protein n=1 Tax=Yoonia sediminilitoris TaxID=1286148 RepID=A0A2T6KEL0_9RHOB|nr:trypsin-like peptidase domain-containing protein [Yoonia sediminilitoris]PUB13566.1 putative peptidoglycan binding protein [Yoonia sediminilitoris]RCW94736.1 putative peptidoglycan binding protein [Yoonia sediminilitoris]
MSKLLTAIFFTLALTVSAAAQSNFWVQIEARNTLSGAQERASEYTRRLDNVAGFYLGNNFYGIVIGPFSQAEASITLDRLLARGAIPSDSFVKSGQFFKQQFWPIGGGTSAAATPPAAEPLGANAAANLPSDPIETPDETPAEARASERLLSLEERQELQKALKWAGYYTVAIDGSFGRGTRASMQAWQIANNQEPTGILTTRQRALLFEQYNGVLDGLDLRLVRDTASGIQMEVPTGVVGFIEYQPPFVRFDANSDIPQAQVLFISQAGDEGKMIGLYEVLQILDIVPPDGPRSRTPRGFTIEGIGDGLHTYVSASLVDGEIKGFVLVWPEGDDQRRTRLIEEMEASFERLPGVLDPDIAPPGEDQAIDMVSGLAVRKPQFTRSGFFVTEDGAVVTTTQAVAGCARITLDRDDEAEVVFTDAEIGLAILRPVDPIVPRDVAAFLIDVPRLQDQIAVAGYPFNGALSAPTLTFGQIIDIRGLSGDDRIKRLAILPQPGDSGGPVFDDSGSTIGMLLPRADGSVQILPPEVNFSLDAGQIVATLTAQGFAPTLREKGGPISPVALTRQAADVAVLVSCW